MNRRLIVVATTIGLGVVMLGAPTANADTSQGTQTFTVQQADGSALPPEGGPTPDSPQSCAADPTYSTWNGVGTFIGDAYRIVRGRGPETISLQTTGSDTVSATFGDTTGVSVGGIIASADVKINNDIASAVSSGVIMGATYAIPNGHLGWLQWGNWGWHYYWSYGHYAGCTWVTKEGQSNSPQYDGKGFNHGYT